MNQQSQYINMFREENIDAVVLTHNIDQPFVTFLEQKNKDVHFQRIDSDISDSFKDEENTESEEIMKEKTETLTSLFRKALNNDKLNVIVEKLKNESVSSMITLSEENRRMQDLSLIHISFGRVSKTISYFVTSRQPRSYSERISTHKAKRMLITVSQYNILQPIGYALPSTITETPSGITVIFPSVFPVIFSAFFSASSRE